MPAAFILAGYALLDVHEKYLRRLNGMFLKVTAALAIAVIAGDLMFILPYSREVSNYSNSSFAYQQNIQDIHPPFLFGLVARPKIFLPPNPAVADYPRFTAKPVSKLSDVMEFFSTSVPKGRPASTFISCLELSPYEFYWQFSDRDEGIRSAFNYAMGDPSFWSSEYFLELVIDDSSPYRSQIADNSLSKWLELSRPIKQKGLLKLYSKKEFQDLGITAKIYRNALYKNSP
jgi:hypothetical protein